MFDVIIVMAGSGQRTNLGYNKAFYKINDKPVFLYSIEKFRKFNNCNQIILVVNPQEIQEVKKYVSNVTIVSGGATRLESVYNGTKEVKSEYVLIHDAARPNILISDIKKVLDTLKTYDACALAVKPSNTIKEIKDEMIVRTLNRDSLVEVQTPQAFKSELYLEAINKAINDDKVIYDDLQIMEKYGNKVAKLVYGSYSNIKITNPIDLKIIEIMMKEGL